MDKIFPVVPLWVRMSVLLLECCKSNIITYILIFFLKCWVYPLCLEGLAAAQRGCYHPSLAHTAATARRERWQPLSTNDTEYYGKIGVWIIALELGYTLGVSLLVGFECRPSYVSCPHSWTRTTTSPFGFCPFCPGSTGTPGWSVALTHKVPFQEDGCKTPFCKGLKCRAERQETILQVSCKLFRWVFS